MTIEAYLEKHGLTEADLGNACRPPVRQGTINRLIHRTRMASVNLSLRIERASNDEIKAEDVPMTRESLRSLMALRSSASAA